MKILFVGDGPNDVRPEFAPQARQAAGIIVVLTRMICNMIVDPDSKSYYWREIDGFAPKGKTSIGYMARARNVPALAVRDRCSGIICVVDRDGEGNAGRIEEIKEGIKQGLNGAKQKAVCGMAIESIEAWVLGAPSALAATLKIDATELRQYYKPADVETFKVRSGKPEKRSKDLLQSLAKKYLHEDASSELHGKVAEQADLAELEANCQEGFRPFAEELRSVFGRCRQES